MDRTLPAAARRSLLAAVPLLALVLTGCPIWGHDSDDGRGPGPGPTPPPPPCIGSGCDDVCRADADCPDGLYCDEASGDCVAGGLCNADDDCDAGFICDRARGTCIPGSRTCVTHGDCAEGRACVDDECTPTSVCGLDGDCSDAGAGYVCDERGTCVPGSSCSAATCMNGVCIDGTCRPNDQVCQFNRDCGTGRACVNNECTELCGAGRECPTGQECVGGLCRDRTGGDPECTLSSDCPMGDHCDGGICRDGCTTDTQCADSEYCDAGLCRPDWHPEPFCTTDADCAMGSRCVDGVCRTPCPGATNEECMRFDVQLTMCGSDGYCYTQNESNPECRTAADCAATSEDCIDGICR